MKTIKIYIDEAGRGPRAGPVMVCGVVIVDPKLDLSMYDDSKALRPHIRDKLYDKVIKSSSYHQIHYHTAYCTEKTIDRYGIVYALHHCIDKIGKYFVALLGDGYQYKLIIDGNRTFGLEKKRDVETVIHGDTILKPISMASIVAKVKRDRMMIYYDKKFPGYGFASHKGYGTKYHATAILEKGISPIHRVSYLKNILQTG